MRYRKKPIVIEAVKWRRGKNTQEIKDFLGDTATVSPDRLGVLGIVTLEGVMWADDGDWIIRGVAGEFYPCKPAIFEASYEAATEEGTP